MAVNKVVYDGNTLIDLTGDTVTADKLAIGYTAHGANGVQLTGTGEMLSDYFYIGGGDLHTDYKLVINNNFSVAPEYNQTDGSYAQLDTDNEGGGGNIILKSGYEISSSNAYGGIVAAGALDGVAQTQSYGSGTSVSAPQGEARILATHGSMPYSNLTTKAMVEAIATETTSEVNIDAVKLNVSGNLYLQNAHTIRGYDTNGNVREVLQVTNTNDNVVLGWGGWDASQGATNIYGNYLNIASREKPTINGALIGVDWNYNNTGWSVMYRQDGLVEVRKDVTASLNYGTWGSMYEAAISDFQPYPWTFPSRPSTRVEPYYVNTGGIMCIEYSPSTTQTTHFPKIWAIRPTTVSGSSIGCTLIAVGRKP